MTQGIESVEKLSSEEASSTEHRVVSIEAHHQLLVQIEMLDVTDDNNQLVHRKEWLIHHKDVENIRLSGNLFVVESTLDDRGVIFVKIAPLPHIRMGSDELIDLSVKVNKTSGFDYILHKTGPEDIESWVVLEYKGGQIGATRALHRWQQSLRPKSQEHRVPKFLSNSWGDRNRDARIQEKFILEEIDKAAELGVDVVQIDDGWQKGRTANSSEAKEKGGVWVGFWEADPEFWSPDPDRFPNGLEPLIQRASENGVELGLWYAPDSWEEFTNWEKDVDTIIDLHQSYGVNHFKLDSIIAETDQARRHLASMFREILSRSEGKIVCDLDVTAGKRPGYFGELTTGPLFVENRYSDWHSYWPHFTLRNLWQLSQWIDPRRLRMELLNNGRNQEKYAGDPLAPALYPPATLFATVMFSSPLGWFENTGLSDAYVQEVSDLVSCWKQHREKLFAGDIFPLGEVPDGVSWTGFLSLSQDQRSGYAVIFNEKSPSAENRVELPVHFSSGEILKGNGTFSVEGDQLVVGIDQAFGYLFIKLMQVHA